MNINSVLIIVVLIVLFTAGCIEDSAGLNDQPRTIIHDEKGANLQEKTESLPEAPDLIIQETPQLTLTEEKVETPKNENQTTLEKVATTTVENVTQKIPEEETNTTIAEAAPVKKEENATYLGGEIQEKTTMTVKEENVTLEVMIYRCDDDYSEKCFDSSGYSLTEKWKVNRYIVHPDQIQLNVPIDGIPSIDDPKFITVNKADEWIQDNELVLAIIYKGVKRVYPLQIMQWHEIVNDNIAGDPILITYCPLCGSGIAFERTFNDKEVKFGVSGALYNSNLVMYDKKTKTFWTQIDGLGIIGELSGTKLKQISMDTVVWRDWKKEHPDSEVLSQNTGYYREYGRDSYGSYYENSFVYFPVENEDQRIHPKTVVFGIEVNGLYKAYKEDDLKELKTIEDTVNGVRIKVERDDAGIVKITNQENGKEIVKERDFWFAWYAFHPYTLLYER